MLRKILLRLCLAGLSFCVSAGLVTAIKGLSSPDNIPVRECHKTAASADSPILRLIKKSDLFPYQLYYVCQLPLKAIKSVKPKYPSMASCARLQGEIGVEIEISAEGRVTSAKAISGPSLLRALSVAAAIQWKFEPVRINNRPVPGYAVLWFKFNLDGKGSVETRICRTS